MLADYLEFLRGYFSTAQSVEQVTSTAAELPADDNMIYQATREAVAFGTANLDKWHKTDNYLPIFYLRNQFPSLSREKLDQALYRLQAADKIDFSTDRRGRSIHQRTNLCWNISSGGRCALLYFQRDSLKYFCLTITTFSSY